MASTETNLKVLRATQEDIEGIASCCMNAFIRAPYTQAPFFAKMLTNSQSTHQFFFESLGEQMRRQPKAVFLKVVNVNEPETLAGFVKWTPPDCEDSYWADAAPGADEELSNAFFGGMAENRASLMGERPHWYLELMAVDPKYARKGAGAMLVEHGLELVDQDGVESYVDASPLAKQLYERYGYITRNTMSMPKPFEWFIETFMVRPAKSS